MNPIAILLCCSLGFCIANFPKSTGVSVSKNDDVSDCVGFHSIASEEAWSCSPYGYGDEESMNPDFKILRMMTHAPFWKLNTADGLPVAAPRWNLYSFFESRYTILPELPSLKPHLSLPTTDRRVGNGAARLRILSLAAKNSARVVGLKFPKPRIAAQKTSNCVLERRSQHNIKVCDDLFFVTQLSAFEIYRLPKILGL